MSKQCRWLMCPLSAYCLNTVSSTKVSSYELVSVGVRITYVSTQGVQQSKWWGGWINKAVLKKPMAPLLHLVFLLPSGNLSDPTSSL